MTNDLTTLASELRALCDKWGTDIARSAFEKQAAGLTADQRIQLESLVFGDPSDLHHSPPLTDEPRAGTVDMRGGTIYGPTVGLNLGTIIYGRTPHEEERHRLVWYLARLSAHLNQVPLQGIETRLAQQGAGVALSSVYVMLATQSPVKIIHGFAESLQHYFNSALSVSTESLRDAYHPDHVLPDKAITFIHASQVGEHEDDLPDPTWVLSRALLATEAVQQHARLVLLGDPGSGKSTFVRHLAWIIAQRERGQIPADQRLLDMPTRLPILVPLQRLARHLAAAGGGHRAVTAALRAAIEYYDVGPVDDMLNAALQRGAALLLFDGLDEVPLQAEPGDRVDRVTTLQAVRDFAHLHPTTPMLVTCRVRAFADDLRACLGWPVETLAPFTLGQVRHFVPAWYAELVATNHLSPDAVERLTTILVERVAAHRQLCEMAQTPLLLTMMALVLYNKGELPRDRPQLYEAILDLLIGRWDTVQDRGGQSLTTVIGRPDWTSKQILPLLDQLSYAAHQIGSTDGRGRLARRDVRDTLIAFFQQAGMTEADAFAAAGRFLDYIDHRSGLLTPDTDESYVFAHLTVQEHCAGRHIVLGSEDPIALAMQHRADDRWREPLFLGMGLAPPADLNDLLEALLDREEDEQPKPTACWYRDLILAAELGQDRDWAYLRTLPRIKVARLQAVLRAGLVELLSDRNQPLPVTERVRAGFLLGDLGDPRVPVTVEEWRHALVTRSDQFGAQASYFPAVRAGMYHIGRWEQKTDLARMKLPAFWIARFLITVAQYAPFVAAGYGLDAERWWTPNGWLWKGEISRTRPYRWNESSYNSPNQPVIGVTWYEAVAFCTWLTEQVQQALPEGYVIRLPTEAEWEAAVAYDGDGRRQPYPWGSADPTPEHAIFKDDQGNNPGRPVPVGCCPAGAAACGALDMAGNVWEVTTSSYEAYPAQSRVDKKDFTPDEYDVPWRGGSWYNYSSYVRCGARLSYDPGNAYDFESGFRVVLAPFCIADSR